jgi:hypothetical protein
MAFHPLVIPMEGRHNHWRKRLESYVRVLQSSLADRHTGRPMRAILLRVIMLACCKRPNASRGAGVRERSLGMT